MYQVSDKQVTSILVFLIPGIQEDCNATPSAPLQLMYREPFGPLPFPAGRCAEFGLVLLRFEFAPARLFGVWPQAPAQRRARLIFASADCRPFWPPERVKVLGRSSPPPCVCERCLCRLYTFQALDLVPPPPGSARVPSHLAAAPRRRACRLRSTAPTTFRAGRCRGSG